VVKQVNYFGTEGVFPFPLFETFARGNWILMKHKILFGSIGDKEAAIDLLDYSLHSTHTDSATESIYTSGSFLVLLFPLFFSFTNDDSGSSNWITSNRCDFMCVKTSDGLYLKNVINCIRHAPDINTLRYPDTFCVFPLNKIK
jgi:hypothetical protein